MVKNRGIFRAGVKPRFNQHEETVVRFETITEGRSRTLKIMISIRISPSYARLKSSNSTSSPKTSKSAMPFYWAALPITNSSSWPGGALIRI